MGFAPKFLLVMLAALVVFMPGCALQPEKTLSRKQVSRPVVSKWYDDTHCDYYDVYGPVKIIKLLPNELTPQLQILVFNEKGRLISKTIKRDVDQLEVQYKYTPQGDLEFIESFLNQRPYRVTEYLYDAQGGLVKTRYSDKNSGEQFHVQHKLQPVKNGWFVISQAVERVDMVDYHQYDLKEQLVWSNKGGINNGSGDQYYLDTMDAITSGRVIEENSANMQGVAGYGYEYDGQGRLQQVVSYNANDNGVFHTTSYVYNGQSLLQEERKVVSGKSLFNNAENASATYDYRRTDYYGNWLERVITIEQGGVRSTLLQRREIEYFP